VADGSGVGVSVSGSGIGVLVGGSGVGVSVGGDSFTEQAATNRATTDKIMIICFMTTPLQMKVPGTYNLEFSIYKTEIIEKFGHPSHVEFVIILSD